MSRRQLDPCPACGAEVDYVTGRAPYPPIAEPCGHLVRVTLHEDRVELQHAL